jgi:beta-lactamase regulating signal transducer with metallopeptidase domain
MTESILEYALGNTILAVPLAVLAFVIGRSRRAPALAHVAWVLVLVRLAMPPIASVPWLSLSVPVLPADPAAPAVEAVPQVDGPRRHDARFATPHQRASLVESSAVSGVDAAIGRPVSEVAPAPEAAIDPWQAAGILWFGGTAAILAVSATRVARFRRELRAACTPAAPDVVDLARRAAADLGTPMRAAILVTGAGTVPFVWAFVGRATIVLPAGVVAAATKAELRLILMHELAHVRRGDHLVRWLDWAVVAWLWWNPLAWIARRGLRSTEELACDALVLRTRDTAPREYGRCLLSVAESLAGSASRAPVQACTMGDGGSLEQRIRFIMSGSLQHRPSLPVRLATVAVAALSMAAGVACASVAKTDATPASAQQAPAPSAPMPAANAPAASPGGSAERTLQASIDDPKSLDVEVDNGSITVIRDDSLKSMQVTVVVGDRSDSRSDSDSHRAAVQGATLVAERDSSGQVKVRVNLPGLGLFRNNPPSTNVTVRTPGLSGVRAESMNGSIRTEGDLGKLALETINGSIDAAGAASVVEADSNNGSISIAGTMTSVKAESTNGNVDISGAMASARAETANGKIRIAVPAGSKAVIDAESVNGGITLEIPASWDGAIDASTTNGRLRVTDIDGTTTPDVLGATFRREAASGSSAKAKLDVTNGSITLKRS